MSTTHWVLIGIGVLGLVVGAEAVLRITRNPPPPPRPPYATAFDYGDPAPEFTLPDSRGATHPLKELVDGSTLLLFVDQSQHSREFASYMREMLGHVKKDAPRLVTVAVFPREHETEFRKATGITGPIVYTEPGSPVVQEYKADPAPRAFGLDESAVVRYVSASAAETGLLQTALAIAQQYGLQNPMLPGAKNAAPRPRGLRGTPLPPAAAPSMK
ncbi:MAG: TlpA family protein disulfide reductase [Armatimonadota bacterium]